MYLTIVIRVCLSGAQIISSVLICENYASSMFFILFFLIIQCDQIQMLAVTVTVKTGCLLPDLLSA